MDLENISKKEQRGEIEKYFGGTVVDLIIRPHQTSASYFLAVVNMVVYIVKEFL